MITKFFVRMTIIKTKIMNLKVKTILILLVLSYITYKGPSYSFNQRELKTKNKYAQY